MLPLRRRSMTFIVRSLLSPLGSVILLIFLLTAPALSQGSSRTELVASRSGYHLLKTLPRMWSGSSKTDCRTYEDKNILRLQPWFMERAAHFLDAFTEAHGPVVITSAHRNTEEQRCVCDGEKGPCAGRLRSKKVKKGKKTIIVKFRGSSRHASGLALDVRAGTGTDEEFKCMHEFAASNPQFGVHFPLGMRDRTHMEPSTTKFKRVRYASLAMPSLATKLCSSMPAYARWTEVAD